MEEVNPLNVKTKEVVKVDEVKMYKELRYTNLRNLRKDSVKLYHELVKTYKGYLVLTKSGMNEVNKINGEKLISYKELEELTTTTKAHIDALKQAVGADKTVTNVVKTDKDNKFLKLLTHRKSVNSYLHQTKKGLVDDLFYLSQDYYALETLRKLLQGFILGKSDYEEGSELANMQETLIKDIEKLVKATLETVGDSKMNVLDKAFMVTLLKTTEGLMAEGNYQGAFIHVLKMSKVVEFKVVMLKTIYTMRMGLQEGVQNSMKYKD